MDEKEWAKGYGAIRHSDDTRMRVGKLADHLTRRTVLGDGLEFYDVLHAADRLACAGMWLVAHETYAHRVYMDGRPLQATDFKARPEGHMGGSLNMVPAYVGYLVANVLTGQTRAWLMGQGHCVGAIDSINLLIGNMTPAHAARYRLDDDGLTRYVQDFYSMRIGADGRPESPLGSHVNAHTAGGIAEGGYLGFAELQYVHMPLPGERLVAFLSDGAFEEQRGSDWAPRWWRAKDSGLVTPIMIKNGRRIDQRTTMAQSGGVEWFRRHLTLNGFDPIVLDGRDPAAFAWAILEIEERLSAAGEAAGRGQAPHPVPLPYGIAVAPKGAGFYGEGRNLAHNLPLGTNPHVDAKALERFNESAHQLWVAPEELRAAVAKFQTHGRSGRPLERDHPLAKRQPLEVRVPPPSFRPVTDSGTRGTTTHSPMAAVDEGFLRVVQANPHLRPRVGNPDEMKSNRMLRTLEALKFRVTDPEPQVPEDVDGAVITALNEEAVAAAALANQGGINIVVTYEAFAPKMHGVFRQEITFAQNLAIAGRPASWISVPLVLTSHTWENAKNEQSHQDPSLAESLLGETSEISRVLFPADYNTAAAAMEEVFRTRGQIWAMVVSKADDMPDYFTSDEARLLLADGALRLSWAGYRPEAARLVLVAVGGYQLRETLRASQRLTERKVEHSVVYMIEPGRFRTPRSEAEARHLVSDQARGSLFPSTAPTRVFFTHTRPEPLLGVLQPINTGASSTAALGYINQGATMDVSGLLYLNRSTWADGLAIVSRLLGQDRSALLLDEEIAALDRRRSPHGVLY